MDACARTNTIAALLAGAADPAAAERLEVHLDQCPACRRLVADLGRGLSAIASASPGALAHGLPRPGESIGRYEILRVVGVGGMGVVYEAHDTTLARGVAVKLLRPDLLEGPSLLAEAQAMARLQHPNIVTVYDAGISAGQLYVCMEYVAGATLRTWLTERSGQEAGPLGSVTRGRPRDWRAIIDVFAAAGEGLAYVHRAGLVHLDFKPDNVLVDRDGRVRVTDFGLARIVGASPVRGIVGTPAYMAPEQRSGAVTDARSDQYAFCVALREALAATDSPRWLDRILDRGLASHPDDRFASLDDLLATIAAALAPRRRRAVAFAAVAATALTALVWTSLSSPASITRIVERPIARTVIEYKDRVHAAETAPLDDEPPTPVIVAKVELPAAELSTPVAARGFVPSRRAPVLHFDALASSAAVTPVSLEASDDPSRGQGSGGYCDDGSTLSCTWWAPSCPTGTIVAIQQGCWTCADLQTCGPLGFPRTCNDGSLLRCKQAPPLCAGHRVAAVRNGCWSCEDPFACWSHTPLPKQPPPRPPPRPNEPNDGSNGGSNSGSGGGSNGGSNAGASCGNGMCEVGETHAACAFDCCETNGSGSCLAKCGNGFCEIGEDHASCSSDCCQTTGSGSCAAVCGNGFCEEGETAASCPTECSVATSPKDADRWSNAR